MSKKDKVGMALIGVGSWSGVIADAVKRSKKAELVTCFSRSPEKRKGYSKKYGCAEEKSYEDVLKREEVDGVLLTTPNAVHAEQAVLAAQHGKHVFVDKPIANTLADGKKMVEACRKAKVALLVGHDKEWCLDRAFGGRSLKLVGDSSNLSEARNVLLEEDHARCLAGPDPGKQLGRRDKAGVAVDDSLAGELSERES